MNAPIKHCPAQPLLATAALALLLLTNPDAVAGPGAHGPNGEHLDGPASAVATAAPPRVEAKTEAFELVAELRATELSILIDRYETNEPVLGARLDVESGGLKAVAVFHADHGGYAVTDAALLKALATPGEHALVFTLVAGSDSDLLDGTLVSRTAGAGAAAAAPGDHGHDDHGHGHGDELRRAAWIGGGVAALGLIGGIAWWRQRRSGAGALKGGL